MEPPCRKACGRSWRNKDVTGGNGKRVLVVMNPSHSVKATLCVDGCCRHNSDPESSVTNAERRCHCAENMLRNCSCAEKLRLRTADTAAKTWNSRVQLGELRETFETSLDRKGLTTQNNSDHNRVNVSNTQRSEPTTDYQTKGHTRHRHKKECGGGCRTGLQGFPPGQGSTAYDGGDLHGFSPGASSTGRPRGGPQGFTCRTGFCSVWWSCTSSLLKLGPTTWSATKYFSKSPIFTVS